MRQIGETMGLLVIGDRELLIDNTKKGELLNTHSALVLMKMPEQPK